MENKKPTILIVLLILIVLGLSGYIVYDKFFTKEEEEKQYITVINDVSIDVNKLYKVGEILNTFDKAFGTNDTIYFGYLYKNKIIDVREFDKNAALYVSLYDYLIRSNTDQTISNSRVKNRYESIFGKTLVYSPSTLELGDNIKVTYDGDNGIYKYKASITSNDHKGEYLARNIKTVLKDDLVKITRKVFYVEYSNSTATIYTDSTKTTNLGEVNLKNGEVALQEVTGKYGSKLNTYEITFKLGEDDEYNFYKIERTK